MLKSHIGMLCNKEFKSLRWLVNSSPACLADILRVHNYHYIHAISQLASSLHPQTIAKFGIYIYIYIRHYSRFMYRYNSRNLQCSFKGCPNCHDSCRPNYTY